MTAKRWVILCGLILVLLLGLTQAALGTAQVPGSGSSPTPMPHEPHSPRQSEPPALVIMPTPRPTKVTATDTLYELPEADCLQITVSRIYGRRCVPEIEHKTVAQGSVSVDDVWTNDGGDDWSTRKTIFQQGDPIGYVGEVNNQTGDTATAYFVWNVTGRGGQIASWSGNLDTGAGVWWWRLLRTVPTDAAPGWYTYSLSVTYIRQTSSRSTTFLVEPPVPTPTSTSTATPTATPTRTPTVTPTPRYRVLCLPLVMKKVTIPTPSPPLCNGDFETGTFSPCWTEDAELACSVVERLDVGEPTPTIEPAYAGRYSALLGDPSLGDGLPGHPPIPVGNAWIEQAVAVPNTASPRLSFWYRIITYDVAQDALRQFWDMLALEINGELVFWDGKREPGTSQRRHDLGWRWGEVDLSRWRGQTVRLSFANWNGYSRGLGAELYNTWTYLDEVQVEP